MHCGVCDRTLATSGECELIEVTERSGRRTLTVLGLYSENCRCNNLSVIVADTYVKNDLKYCIIMSVCIYRLKM